MKTKITLTPHKGFRAIHNSRGDPVRNVEVDTGMQRIYYEVEEGGESTRQQIGFVHPNGFMHFIIPDPPDEFKQEVKQEVERITSKTVTRVGAPPPIGSADEGSTK